MKAYTLFAVIEVLLIILIVLFDIKWLISVLLLYLFLIPFIFALFEDSMSDKNDNKFFDRDYLTQGVWVEYCDHAFCNGKYLKEKFRLEKVSDLQYPTIAEMGGMEAAIHQAWRELLSYKEQALRTTGYSEYDGYYFIVKRTLEIMKERGKKE